MAPVCNSVHVLADSLLLLLLQLLLCSGNIVFLYLLVQLCLHQALQPLLGGLFSFVHRLFGGCSDRSGSVPAVPAVMTITLIVPPPVPMLGGPDALYLRCTFREQHRANCHRVPGMWQGLQNATITSHSNGQS